MNNHDPALAPDPLDGIISSAQILNNHYPPVEYIVPGILPEGLAVLVAAPKIGKSWMVLGIAVAAASGGTALGSIPVDRRPVLYLALEDGQRRLQSRLNRINATPEAGLSFLTSLDHRSPGEVIGTYLQRNGDQKPLVILDTLGKVRGVSSGNDQYGRDYSQMSALKDLVDAYPGSALIVVHHTRKGDSADFLDSVSGTQGIAGAADTIAKITRDRNTGEATLHITSRDAAEGEYAVTMTEGVWTLDGATLAEAAQAVGTREVKAGVGDTMGDLLEVVARYPDGIRPQEVADILKWPRKKVDTYLPRAVEQGRVARLARGVYAPVGSVGSEGKADLNPQLPTPPTNPTPSQATACTKSPECHRVPAPGSEWCQHHITLNHRSQAVMAKQTGAAA